MKYSNEFKEMPEVISKLILTINEMYPKCSLTFITNTVLAKIAHTITSKRIRYKEYENISFPNYFAINFIPSGLGKDKILDDIDKHFLTSFSKWFKNESQNYKKQQIEKIRNKYSNDESSANDEIKQIRDLVSEVSDGTREGLFANAKIFSKAKIGSILIKNSEFASYLQDASNEQKLFLNQLNEAYNNKIIAKVIKGEIKGNNIVDVPVNAILHSDPSILMLQNNIKKTFNTLMENGLGRRSVITFMPFAEEYVIEYDFEKAHEKNNKYYKRLGLLEKKFMELFNMLKSNSIYELTEDAYKELHSYKISLEERLKIEENTILLKEIASRELKAIKVSCLYACCNHPDKLEINALDMKQARGTVEMLCYDLKKFLNYRPKSRDKYDNVFLFFENNLNQPFSKTELINKYRDFFGISRDKLRMEFDNIIEVVTDIATEKGYAMCKKSINRGSGFSYSLKRIQLKELSSNVIPLPDLL